MNGWTVFYKTNEGMVTNQYGSFETRADAVRWLKDQQPMVGVIKRITSNQVASWKR